RRVPEVSASPGRPVGRAVAPPRRRREVSRADRDRRVPRPAGAARGGGEPRHHGTHALQRGGAGVQHQAQQLPHGADRRPLRQQVQREAVLPRPGRGGAGAQGQVLGGPVPRLRFWPPAVLARALASPRGASAAEAPLPPAPTRWVTDAAGFLSPSARAEIDARLEAVERATGHQVVVWIGDTIGTAPLDDWAGRTFAAWKGGRKGIDDGLAMFILAADRKIDIEVGYGLEGQVPDAIAARVIRDVMTPRLRAG